MGFSFFDDVEVDCLCARDRRASKAGTRSRTDSFSGVKLGRNESVGKMACSKTCARPVSCRVLSGNLVRKLVRMVRPRLRIFVPVSSTRVRSTGMNRGQCLLMRCSFGGSAKICQFKCA